MICALCHKEPRMLVRTVIKNVMVSICVNCFAQRQAEEEEQAADRDLTEDAMLSGGGGRHG